MPKSVFSPVGYLRCGIRTSGAWHKRCTCTPAGYSSVGSTGLAVTTTQQFCIQIVVYIKWHAGEFGPAWRARPVARTSGSGFSSGEKVRVAMNPPDDQGQDLC